MPVGLQVALFINVYGAATYRNPGYPTADGVIPFKMFLELFDTINRIKSFEIVSNIQAVAFGNAQVTADDKGQRKIMRIIQDFKKNAYGED